MNGRSRRGGGALATPGTYQATLHLEKDGNVTKLDGPISFEVKPIREGVLKGAGYAEYNAFRTDLTSFIQQISEVQDKFDQSKKKLKALSTAVDRSKLSPGSLEPKIADLKVAIASVDFMLEGSPSKEEIGERNPSGVQRYLYNAFDGMGHSYGPTALHKKSLEIAKSMLVKVETEVDKIVNSMIPKIEEALKVADAPYISN
jgi:hypothetical protein